MRVNGQPADPGCYIAGHHGQYGLDGLADVCGQFGIEIRESDDPGFWRRVADGEERSHVSPNRARDYHVAAADRLEEILNEHTEGGYWWWDDGEFFLVQTEREGFIYVLGADYDDAWRNLVDNGFEGYYTESELASDAADDEEGMKVFQFVCVARYEPDELPEAWTPHEIALGLDN